MQAGLRDALREESPLQIVGTINAYTALLAQKAGFKAIYLSGAGCANASYGMPDLGITNLNDVLIDVDRITSACPLPLLVDIDTGWGSSFNIARAIKNLIKAGAAGAHLEDQVFNKRCGHRPKKQLVSTEEMCDRIKAAQDANNDRAFTIMARTDALAVEGFSQVLNRIEAYIESGADMIFFEGATKLSQYTDLARAISKPMLANLTEFGVTPLFSKEELRQAGVQLILYPLSAFRAMNYAAEKTYNEIRNQPSQANLISEMQTRDELYSVLNYYAYESKIDELFAKGTEK